jgi:hypothetical protein
VDRKAILKVLYSPCILAVPIGLIIFLAQIPIPSAISQTISYLAGLNTPLAMLVVGCTLMQSPLKNAFRSGKNYYTVFLRNFLVPMVAAVIYCLIPQLDHQLILINILSTACPSAALIVMFAKKFQKDTAAASQILTLSNIISLISIPLVIFLTQKMAEIL